ncbi:hypothetical protein SAMN06297422_12156 [Lachnospiraceae bacterium]|nr:hypothetical protein SAMN06297422_12156 [Lachnospiraceae bacterium]
MPKELSTKGKIKALKNTFNNQLSFEDRLQTVLMANAYRKASIEQSSLNASQDNSVEMFPEELSDTIDELNEQIFKEMFGDGSMKSIKEGYKKFGYVFSGIITQQGKDYEKILQGIPETETQRENKAAFLAYKQDGVGKYMTGAYQEMFGISGFSSYLFNTPEVNDKIWQNFNFTNNSTVEDYYKGLGKNNDEIEQLCKDNHCEKGSNLIEFFTRTEKEKILNQRKANQKEQADKEKKPIEEIPIDLTEPEITKEDAISAIKRDYVHEFLDICDSNSLNVSYTEAINAVNQLPKVNRDHFAKGNYVYAGTKPTDGNPDHEIHILKGNNKKLAKNAEEEERIGKEIEEFQKWSKEKGESQALQMSKDGVNKMIQGFEAKIFSGKNMGFRDDSARADLYKNEIKSYDVSFLNGVIHDLEDSAKGKSHKDSKEFTKMMKTLREFTYLVSSGSGGSALEKRDNLIKDCLIYIKDKMGRVRTNDYGKKRFDDTLLVLSEIMPEKDFRALVDTINHKRSAKPGSEKYIDYDKTFRDKYVLGSERSRIRLAERAREDKVQQKTLKNQTKMLNMDISRIEIIDALFGRKPKAPDFMISALGGSKGAKEAFSDIKESFVPIGPYRNDFNLSNKDFAAIAYAATLTPEAAAQDTRDLNMTPQQKLNKYGAAYTADFMFDDGTKDCGKWCAGPVQFGREYAASAMRAYAAGQKEPLARILQEGIKTMNNEARRATVLSDTFIANNEMLNRMKGMMNRDPELMRLILKDKGLTREDFTNTRDTALGAKIVTDFKVAALKLKNLKDVDTKEKRMDVVTDIVLKTVYDKYMIQSSAERHKKTGALENFRNPKAREMLRNSVKKYVKDNKLQDISYAGLKLKLRSRDMAIETNKLARDFMNSQQRTVSQVKQMGK